MILFAPGGSKGVVYGDPPHPNRAEFPYEASCTYQGMLIYIENKPGSVRSGTDKDGKPWSVTMLAGYGEFADTLGMDGDPVDVFVGPDATAPTAYVIHQKYPGTAVADEDKVVLGVRSRKEAEQLYRAHYNRGGFLDGVTPWPVAELREHLRKHGLNGGRLDRPKRVRVLIKATEHLCPPHRVGATIHMGAPLTTERARKVAERLTAESIQAQPSTWPW